LVKAEKQNVLGIKSTEVYGQETEAIKAQFVAHEIPGHKMAG
jgi:hypothetical protein